MNARAEERKTKQWQIVSKTNKENHENRFKLPFVSIGKANIPLPPTDKVTFRTVLSYYSLDTATGALDASAAIDFIRGGDLAAAVSVLEKSRDDMDGRHGFIEQLVVAYGGEALEPAPGDPPQRIRPFLENVPR